MKFHPLQFQLHQHCWKPRTNTQRNWHCPTKPVSSKFLDGWDKKRIRSTPQTRQAKTSMCLKSFSFFVRDAGKEDHERIIVFGDNEKVEYLQSSLSWLADGKFKLSPKMFIQLYTIHIRELKQRQLACSDFYHPEQKAHINVFWIICCCSNPNAAANKNLIDFELAAMKAFEKAMPNFTILGCFFLLLESFIGEVGLKKCTNWTQSCRWLWKLHQLWLLKSLKMSNPPSGSSLKIFKKYGSSSPSTRVR